MQTVKAEKPDAMVVGHFLGRSISKISMADTCVEPPQWLQMLHREMSARGKAPDAFYDDWITSVDPTLIGNRGEEQTETDSKAALGRAQKSRRDVGPLAIVFPEQPDPVPGGWNVYWQEEFEDDTDDLVADYVDWVEWQVDSDKTELTPTPVENGFARLNTVETGKTWSVGGGRTASELDVVPDQHFNSSGSSPGSYRNYWTTVMDFYPAGGGPYGAHTPVFLRVNDRTYGQLPDQTRFGSLIYAGAYTEGNCSDQPCGALEFGGDDAADPSNYRQSMFFFVLRKGQSEYPPFDYPTRAVRVQIHEREWYHPLSYVWEPWWMSEAWDLDEANPELRLLGSSPWIGQWTLNNVLGIDTPELTGSRCAIGMGPGNGAGYIDAYFVGAAYWHY